MATNAGSIHIKDSLNRCQLNVTVRGMRAWRIRCWIGTRLIALAAAIMWMPIKVEYEWIDN